MVTFHTKGVGRQVNPKVNFITFDSERLDFNKPKYTITISFDDFHHKPINDLFPAQYQKGFCSINRLDYINKYLMLLINNVTLSYYFIHNKFKNEKTYIVKSLGKLDKDSTKARAEVIKLSSKIIILKKNSNITLKEIIDSQIRKFLSLSSYKVINLKSISLIDINYENLKESYIKIIKDVYVEDI